MGPGVRQGLREDIPALTAMLRRFHDFTQAPWGYEPERMSMYLAGLMENGSGLCLVLDGPGGVLGAEVGTLPWGGPRIAQERFFWIEPDYRSLRAANAMLDAFEAWARERADFTHLTTLGPGGLYVRRGYQAREIHYLKAL